MAISAARFWCLWARRVCCDFESTKRIAPVCIEPVPAGRFLLSGRAREGRANGSEEAARESAEPSQQHRPEGQLTLAALAASRAWSPYSREETRESPPHAATAASRRCDAGIWAEPDIQGQAGCSQEEAQIRRRC